MILNMKDLLEVAKDKSFAVPAFNISDYSMFNGIMEVCEEKNAPVIIAIHPDELRHITSEMVKGIRERIINSNYESHTGRVYICNDRRIIIAV